MNMMIVVIELDLPELRRMQIGDGIFAYMGTVVLIGTFEWYS